MSLRQALVKAANQEDLLTGPPILVNVAKTTLIVRKVSCAIHILRSVLFVSKIVIAQMLTHHIVMLVRECASLVLVITIVVISLIHLLAVQIRDVWNVTEILGKTAIPRNVLGAVLMISVDLVKTMENVATFPIQNLQSTIDMLVT